MHVRWVQTPAFSLLYTRLSDINTFVNELTRSIAWRWLGEAEGPCGTRCRRERGHPRMNDETGMEAEKGRDEENGQEGDTCTH